MRIIFHENTKVFHLYNEQISYIMQVLPSGQMGQLYFGKCVQDRESYDYLMETNARSMAVCAFKDNLDYSIGHLKQEYGIYGSGDYRSPAVEICQSNGSRLSHFVYKGYEVTEGKPKLLGLPATYTENPNEAKTLTLKLQDEVTGVYLHLSYTIFAKGGILTRSARFVNHGDETVHLTTAMSMCLDLPDADYEWMQFSGAWSRERHVKIRKLEAGIVSIGSTRGHSSHEHNPFIILKRPMADEFQGEAIGFSLVYSGNFLAQAEVDGHETTRILMGIHPQNFDWRLECGQEFQTPEAVMVYTDQGLNHLSQTFHRLYQKRLARGYWRDRVRPILINNWEATYFDFTEEKILEIAAKAKECGVELFVLDDGWFGARRNEKAGLGDWAANEELLPSGITGLSEKINDMGMKFGLWFEPEMINENSDLYRAHPDWVIQTPNRLKSHGRHQYVLDYSRKEVVDHIYEKMSAILRAARISYVKWDMNRSISEYYCAVLPADQQGEVFHRYILGVYDLYERLTGEFPEVLFESCASGGARFDPGLLYFAPQGWTSDDTDAIERLKIQHGTSYCYPISSMGSHVSVIPNHQTGRKAPLHTRANVAYFGTFGYELDLNQLTQEEQTEVKRQVEFMKEHRQLLQFGSFYRISSPFDNNVTVWMVVSEDRKEAIVGWYRVLNGPNKPYSRVKLQGLHPDYLYELDETQETFYGNELMNIGLVTSRAGDSRKKPMRQGTGCDFDSQVFVLKAR